VVDRLRAEHLGPEFAKAGIAVVLDPRPKENFFRRSATSRSSTAHRRQTLSTFNMHTDYHHVSDEATSSTTSTWKVASKRFGVRADARERRADAGLESWNGSVQALAAVHSGLRSARVGSPKSMNFMPWKKMLGGYQSSLGVNSSEALGAPVMRQRIAPRVADPLARILAIDSTRPSTSESAHG